MNEEEARQWIDIRFGKAALADLARFADLVVAESMRQNLIAASTVDHLWVRHILDSAQLVPLAVAGPGTWLDIGTGAGFPGIVTAILSGRATRLVEPRRRRVAFLTDVIGSLGLEKRVGVVAAKVESERGIAAIISARAVSQIDVLFASAARCADAETLWLLPKGRSALEEVARAERSWHGVFHVEQSVTDPGSLVVIANKVSRR